MFDNLSLDMFGYLMPNNPPPPNLRDFQRQKLYRFEEARLQKHPFNLDLTLPECTTLARKYNPRIKVKDGRGRRHVVGRRVLGGAGQLEAELARARLVRALLVLEGVVGEALPHGVMAPPRNILLYE